MNKLSIIGRPTIFGDLDFLENFRFSNKRKFPISYKKFVKEYGYGRALGGWFIYIPMGNYGDSWLEQNPLFKERFEYVLDWDEEIVDMILEPDGSRELMQKCEPFAKSEDGSYLFWDIESQPIEEEFDIYLTDFSGLGVRKVATSIDELFDKMTDNNLFKEVEPLFRQEPYPAIFECIEELYYEK